MREKRYTFTKAFVQAAEIAMAELGLQRVERHREANGTLMWSEPSGVVYALYESGYCRRLVPTNMHWGTADSIGGRRCAMYQLNRTAITEKVVVYAGKRYTHRGKERIMASPYEQLGICVAAIARWRSRG